MIYTCDIVWYSVVHTPVMVECGSDSNRVHLRTDTLTETASTQGRHGKRDF